MILHFFLYEKFTNDYIERINKLFNPEDHLFLIFREKHDEKIPTIKAKNVIYNKDFKSSLERYKYLIKASFKADKIIFHSLFLTLKQYRFFISMSLFLGKKYFWNIWGADLYNAYWDRELRPDKEKLRVKFIKTLHAVGYIPSDYEFLKQHYVTKAKFYLASYTYDFFIPEIARDKKDTVNILLGNSASETCQYEDAIDRLVDYKNMQIKVYCVLSYPDDKEYIAKIKEYGKQRLGDKFVPMTEFMKYDEYTEFLNSVDIAIFNHNRQQALGNIASLLYLGKRVFINEKNGCKGYFEDMGVELYSIDDISANDICVIDDTELKLKNRAIIEDFFSDKQFAYRWNRIFTEKY